MVVPTNVGVLQRTTRVPDLASYLKTASDVGPPFDQVLEQARGQAPASPPPAPPKPSAASSTSTHAEKPARSEDNSAAVAAEDRTPRAENSAPAPPAEQAAARDSTDEEPAGEQHEPTHDEAATDCCDDVAQQAAAAEALVTPAAAPVQNAVAEQAAEEQAQAVTIGVEAEKKPAPKNAAKAGAKGDAKAGRAVAKKDTAAPSDGAKQAKDSAEAVSEAKTARAETVVQAAATVVAAASESQAAATIAVEAPIDVLETSSEAQSATDPATDVAVPAADATLTDEQLKQVVDATRAAANGEVKPTSADATAAAADQGGAEGEPQATASSGFQVKQNPDALTGDDANGTKDGTNRDAAASAERLERTAIAATGEVPASDGSAGDATAALPEASDASSGAEPKPALTQDTSANKLDLAPAPVTAAPLHERLQRAAPETRTEAAASGNSLHEADRLRLIQRVMRAMQTAGDDGGVLRLRLTPPELGSVRMEIQVREGTLSARLTAETETARAVLLENLPALRDRLAEQSMRLERFDVDLQGQGGEGQARQPGDEHEAYQAGGWQRPRERRADPPATAPAVAPRTARVIDDRGGLNVVV